MTYHYYYSDLSSTPDWSCRVANFLQPIRGTIQIWVLIRHQYGISAAAPQTSFRGETSGEASKTADIWRRYDWFSRQMTSEKRAQKFHTDDASLPRSWYISASDWLCHVANFLQPIRSTTQIWVLISHQLVWNFCSRSGDVISRGNQWWGCEMLAAFSG